MMNKEDADIYDTKSGTQIVLQQKGEQQKLLFQGIVKNYNRKTKRYLFSDT